MIVGWKDFFTMLVIRFGYILLCYPVVAVESYTVHEKLGPFIIKKALIDILYRIKKEGCSRINSEDLGSQSQPVRIP